jgi:hypothetical protein
MMRGKRGWRVWSATALAVLACGLLASCTSAAAEPASPEAATEPVAPTEMDRAWERTGFPADQRPDVERVRLVSVFERTEVVAECLREAGYPRVVAVNGEVERGDIPEEQLGSYALSAFVCEAKYPTDPMFDRPLTDAQIRELYRYRATEQRECLEGLGYAISLPPAERAFVENYPERGGWNPMNSVPLFGFAAAEAACPPVPGSLAPSPAPASEPDQEGGASAG